MMFTGEQNEREQSLEAAFGAVYEAHVERIFRFVYLKVDSRETCEDLTAETFVRAWKAFQKQGNRPIENMNAFLYKTARNLLTDWYRKKGKIQFVSADNLALQDMRTSVEEQAAVNSDVEVLKRQMSKLNDDYQSVLVWHYVEDLPVSEIALMMNKSENATRVMISRALGALREQVKEA